MTETAMDTADCKYEAALRMYRDTDKTLSQISRECGVSRAGFAKYVQRRHRDLMYARHGIEAADTGRRMKNNKGQNPRTHSKYREAIQACDSERYIHLNVSQIARMFHLDGTALGNQLRAHYPDIVERRERERRRRGIADNFRRGARRYCMDAYAEAVELLRSCDMTIEEVAQACGVSFSGLRQHLLSYHKDIVDMRQDRRDEGKRKPVVGRVSGNGRLRLPDRELSRCFARALELYRSTSASMKDICAATDTDLQAFKHHLHMWHKDLIFRRLGAEPPRDSSDRPRLKGVRRSNPRTAEKYAGAIAELRAGGTTVEETARRHGFVPEVFRSYLKKHQHDLWLSMGMTVLPGGRRVLRRSYEKYAEAIHAYETSTESLRAIALRFGINYNTLSGFIRRNMPEAIRRHEAAEPQNGNQ